MLLAKVIMIMLPAFPVLVADPQTDTEHCYLSNEEDNEYIMSTYSREIEHLERQIEVTENNLNTEALKSQQQNELYTLCLFRGILLENYPTLCLPETDMVGKHEVQLSSQSVEVFCDSKYAGPGWIVIQRRVDEVNFNRKFSDYEQGFGEWPGSFFIGLDKLYQLLSFSQHELYIYLENFNGTSRYARYDHFKIGGSNERYKLESLGTYTGNAGDSLGPAKGKKFMPKDCILFILRCNDGDTPWWTDPDVKSAGYVKC